MNRTAINITLVCYDVTSNKLRNKIDKCMKDFGSRLQFSVFLCRLDADGVARCRENLQRLLQLYDKEKNASDSLIIIERFNPDIAYCLLGAQIEKETPNFAIF